MLIEVWSIESIVCHGGFYCSLISHGIRNSDEQCQERKGIQPKLIWSYLLGVVVNISSLASTTGVAQIVYSSSKAALDQITRCMAVELGPHNIRVNSVNPTLVEDTPMTQDILKTIDKELLVSVDQRVPLKRLPKMEDVVNAVLYLLSEKADMINGAFLRVDAGRSCT